MAKKAEAKKQEQEVQAEEQKTTALAAVDTQGGELAIPETWGNEEVIRSNERIIPKLHLMQGQSGLVSEGRAKIGDIVNLVTGEVLGDSSNPVEVVPIKKMPSTWVIYDVVNGQREFKEIIEVRAENERWEWEVKDAKGNVVQERDYAINFLVLAAKDATIPAVVSFKRTSVKAGKKLVNYFDKCRIDKVAPARYALKLISVKQMNDKKQPYSVFDLLPDKRPSTQAEYENAFRWYQTLQTESFRVDDSDLQDDATGNRKSGSSNVDADVSENSQY